MRGIAVLGVAALAGLTAPAHAQTGSLPFHDGIGPLAIEADGGIEWRQHQRVFVARGNARATQGQATVRANRMTAHYRRRGGETEIWRIEAQGAVRIAARDRRATADSAVYEVDRKVLVLTGRPRLEAAGDRVSATDRMEYRQAENLAVAKGDAVAESGGRRLRADELRVTFEPDEAGNSRLQRVEAFGGMQISTAEESARADRGVYDAKAGTVRLEGGVIIRRGQDRLAGAAADIDLNTGLSRLHAGRDRVRGLVTPQATRRPAGGG